MNHQNIFAGIALATVLVSGCASYGTANAATQESYNAALADAKNSLQLASKANYEWRDSGKILKKADAAAKAGDYSKALKLAEQAKYQGDRALAQSKDQIDAGMR